jgi:hypothetical protein
LHYRTAAAKATAASRAPLIAVARLVAAPVDVADAACVAPLGGEAMVSEVAVAEALAELLRPEDLAAGHGAAVDSAAELVAAAVAAGSASRPAVKVTGTKPKRELSIGMVSVSDPPNTISPSDTHTGYVVPWI